jgi:hypothetical protein
MRKHLGVSISAVVDESVRCPNCDKIVADRGYISWGLCGPFSSYRTPTYRVGDELVWGTLAGVIVPWVYFDDGLGNAGEPGVDVICLDINGRPSPCSACGQVFDWYATEVRENTLVRAWAAAPSEFSGDVDVFIWSGSEWQPAPSYVHRPMGRCLWNRAERQLEVPSEGYIAPDWASPRHT